MKYCWEPIFTTLYSPETMNTNNKDMGNFTLSRRILLQKVSLSEKEYHISQWDILKYKGWLEISGMRDLQVAKFYFSPSLN